MTNNCYEAKNTNPIIARLIYEIFVDTGETATSEKIQRRMAGDPRWSTYLERTLKCFRQRANTITWSIENVPIKFYAHFGQLFPTRIYKLYFDQEGADPYHYKPKPDRLEALKLILAEGELEDIKLQEHGSQQIEFPLYLSEEVEPTADPEELDRRVARIMSRGHIPRPAGQENPHKAQVSNTATVFERDPLVKAWVLQEAAGICELCDRPGPFRLQNSNLFLEVHHVRTLAEGGPDIIGNTVAVCPNCHRRLHYGFDAADQKQLLYDKISRLHRF